VIESKRSVKALKGRATKLQAMAIPRTSPRMIQKAWAPTAYPIPVRPSNSQALSPVELEENAMTHDGSFFPATKYPETVLDSRPPQRPMASRMTR
jgi:hypothetical protein